MKARSSLFEPIGRRDELRLLIYQLIQQRQSTVEELAKELATTKANVTSRLSELQSRGYVKVVGLIEQPPKCNECGAKRCGPRRKIYGIVPQVPGK